MITMNEFVDLRMQQHIAHEIYRQQIMQRIPDPFPAMLPVPMPRQIILPPRVTLPGIEATLQNNDLWKQFHQIGTEMIITKGGRRMFPSKRLSISGLEDDANYCVLLEMVPIGDCRYKFSGSQWVPAGGAEPQSPQRMYLHPDSPAQGSHWQAQPILFNKVKLTNNTLDNNGHIVLTSMHKYQPRIHIIRTSDPTQIPWAPQQAFFFAETEFVAVTAYQNDRITKLKIDNNPFAKGFRETGQSRCKRKMTSSREQLSSSNVSMIKSTIQNQKLSKLHANENGSYDFENLGSVKRIRSDSSACSVSSLDDSGLSSGKSSPANSDDMRNHHPASLPGSHPDIFMQQIHHNVHNLITPSLVDLACSYFGRAPYSGHICPTRGITSLAHGPLMLYGVSSSLENYTQSHTLHSIEMTPSCNSSPVPADVALMPNGSTSVDQIKVITHHVSQAKYQKKSGFTISAILGDDN